jgi:peptidoglycan hydrolase-like protein with peptidoglycan-binding domain
MALASAPLAFAAGDTTRSSTTNMDRSTSSMGAGHYGSASSMDSQTVRQVQQALADKGHNPGPIDGMMGPRTRAALQSYQRQNNLSGAKGLDQQTLDSLGVQAAASASSGRMAGSTGTSGSSTRAGSASGDSASSAGGAGASAGGSGGAMSGNANTAGSKVPAPTSSSSADQGTASDGASNSRFPTPESRGGGTAGGTSR